MKSIMKLWRSFWGNRYRVYKEDEKVAEVLIYHKKIYILSDRIE
ncbi:MAG: hypothetical protein RR334_03635 [Clostridia bacterium]